MELKKIREISMLVSGYRYRGALKTSSQGPISLVQAKDLHALESVNWHDLTRINKDFGSGQVGVQAGDLLLSRQGVRFPCSVVDDDYANVAVSPLVFHLRPDTALVDSNYLSWYLNFGPGAGYLVSNADGALSATIRTEALLDCPVHLPVRQMQRMLADAVSEIAQQIQIYQKLQHINHELLRALSETLSCKTGEA